MSQTLHSLYPQLIEAFSLDEIELKPGATTKDKKKALALPYADVRVYQDRLDAVVGAENWSVEYRSLSDTTVFCRLTVLGAVREDVGECHKVDRGGVLDDNRTCTAVAQAFKRACSALGLGRYIYSLPQVWGEFDGQRKQFVDAKKIIQTIYRRANLLQERKVSTKPKQKPSSHISAIEAFAPEPVKTPKTNSTQTIETLLTKKLQNTRNEAELRTVGDEIRHAKTQNEIDETARKRLEVLYRKHQQKLGNFSKQPQQAV